MNFHPHGIRYLRSTDYGHVFFHWTFDPIPDEGHWIRIDEGSMEVLNLVDTHVVDLLDRGEIIDGMSVTPLVLDHFRKRDEAIVGYRLAQPDDKRWPLLAEVKIADPEKAMLFKLSL